MIDKKLYNINYHPDKNLLIVKVMGYFDMESHKEYTTDLIQTLRTINKKNVNILADLSRASTQSREVAKDSGYMIEMAPYVNKTAMIVISAIYKMQLQRSKGGEKMKFFDDVDAAYIWLDKK